MVWPSYHQQGFFLLEPASKTWHINFLQRLTAAQKQEFPFQKTRIFSVNVTRSAGYCEFGHIYWRNPKWKTCVVHYKSYELLVKSFLFYVPILCPLKTPENHYVKFRLDQNCLYSDSDTISRYIVLKINNEVPCWREMIFNSFINDFDNLHFNP